MKNYLLFAALLLGLSATAQQTAKSLTASNNVFIGFYEYKPVDYNAHHDTKYPLIVFLHGIGERGNGTTDLPRVAANGIPRYIKDGDPMTFTWNGKTETFLVLSPQLSNNYGWWQAFYVEEMIKYAKQNLRIDTNRIIVTGLSLGGGGVWTYAASSPENAKKLAAITPVCPTCENYNWCNIANANLPTWAFHAQDDGTTPANCTAATVSKINDNCKSAVKAYFTLWPNGQHWIWDRAFDRAYNYQNPNVYEWWLAQNKSLAPNKRPVANAGADLSTTTGTGSVTLNGAGSTDSDGKIVRYIWRQVSGPSQVSISASVSTAGSTTISGLSTAGTYQFELKAVDDRADWTTDLVNVTVTSGGAPSAPPQTETNRPAVSKAGPDQNVTLPISSITLDASASYDPDGGLKAYEWTKVGGPDATITNPKSKTTTVTNLNAGTYKFKLVVWGDNWVPANPDTVIVQVNAAPVVNKAPVAVAGSDATITLPANSVSLNGAASYDADGSIAAYAWSKISGPVQGTITNANTANATASNLAEGTYSFRLQVTDNKNAVSADTVVVTVKAAPVPPATGNRNVLVNAGEDLTVILPDNKTILNGSATYDPDGETKAYTWRMISGPSACIISDAKSSIALASNLVQGTYRFELRAWGDNWVPMADTMIVTVKAPVTAGNIAPVVSAGSPLTIMQPANTVTLNGSATHDIDGSIIAYRWTKVSGPDQYLIVDPTAVSPAVINLAVGTYRFCLQATDDDNATNTDTVTVVVQPRGNTPPIPVGGKDITIALPVNSVNVDGSASYDVDGEIKAYLWRYISGPSSYSIANDRNAKTTISNLVRGTYRFELMVWGDNWYPQADTITVSVTDETVAMARNASTQHVSEMTVAPAVKIFPSPATSTINLQYQDNVNGPASAVIYDVAGRKVMDMQFTKDATVYQRTINVSALQPGVYRVAVISKDGQTVGSFVKQ
jgi:predicted esterase